MCPHLQGKYFSPESLLVNYLQPGCYKGSCLFRSTAGGDKPLPYGDAPTEEIYNRETFILCTSPLSLQLFTMEGSNVDTMPISNTMQVPFNNC